MLHDKFLGASSKLELDLSLSTVPDDEANVIDGDVDKVNVLGFRLLFLTRRKWHQINDDTFFVFLQKNCDILCK